MGLKDWFIVSDENATTPTTPATVVEQPKEATRFPEAVKFPDSSASTPSFSNANSSISTVTDEHFQKALELYQNGFDSLNQPGYDFYEFYQAVMNTGVDNPQIYNMAFSMGIAMDKTITKQKLSEQADYYLSEIMKVYNDYLSKGDFKRADVINQKTHENQTLIDSLNSLNQQLEAIKIQITDKQEKLAAIDTKYNPMINEVDNKIRANELAKTKLVDSINKVKQGIITNIN